MEKPKRLLALSRYDARGASSRYRTLRYLPYLEASGWEVDVAPLLDDQYLERLYARRSPSVPRVTLAIFRRSLRLLGAQRYDAIWLEKEALPYVPAAVEMRLLSGAVPYAVDFDDAVFHTYDQHASPVVRRLLGTKHSDVIRGAEAVVVANPYLAGYAERAGAKHIEMIPTVVDLKRYPAMPPAVREEVRIGWIGTPATAKFLEIVRPLAEQNAQRAEVSFILIGSGHLPWQSGNVTIEPWSEESEVELLAALDIGIMPLPDTPFERGKSGLKLLQYMATGLPVLASPIGVNSTIVDHGVNGFLCADTEDWINYTDILVKDAALRRSMGRAGRQKVEREYSLEMTAPKLERLLRSVALSRTK